MRTSCRWQRLLFALVIAEAIASRAGGAQGDVAEPNPKKPHSGRAETRGPSPKVNWGLLDFGDWVGPDFAVFKHHITRIRITLPEKKASPWGEGLVGDKRIVFISEDPRLLRTIESFLRNPLRHALAEGSDATSHGWFNLGSILVTARLEEGRDKETTKGNVYTSESVRSEQFTIYVTDGAFLLGEDSSTMSRTFYSWGLAHVLDDVCLEKAGSHISPKIISGLSGGWRMEAEKKLFEDFKKGTKEDKQRK